MFLPANVGYAFRGGEINLIKGKEARVFYVESKFVVYTGQIIVLKCGLFNNIILKQH